MHATEYCKPCSCCSLFALLACGVHAHADKSVKGELTSSGGRIHTLGTRAAKKLAHQSSQWLGRFSQEVDSCCNTHCQEPHRSVYLSVCAYLPHYLCNSMHVYQLHVCLFCSASCLLQKTTPVMSWTISCG